MLRGLKQPLHVPRHRDLSETVTELFDCLMWRYRSAVDFAGAGALGAVDLGMA